MRPIFVAWSLRCSRARILLFANDEIIGPELDVNIAPRKNPSGQALRD
jgi:hypothetical protein